MKLSRPICIQQPFSGMSQAFGEAVKFSLDVSAVQPRNGGISLTQINSLDSIWNRYLTEDCPNGLVPWSALGGMVGVDCPLMRGIVCMYSSVHEINWWATGRNQTWLGLSGMEKEEILRYVKTGTR